MSSVLPVVFALLAGGVLLVALLSIWQSLRAAFGGEAASGWSVTGESAERQALLEEKVSLLSSLKDLAFDHQIGKLSDADYERLDRALRARAREVLRLLDEDLGPYRERAEDLIKRHLSSEVGRAPYRQAGEPSGDVEETVTCPGCGTLNDPDAKFCKECACKLDGEPAPEAKAEVTEEAKAEVTEEAKAEVTEEAKAEVTEEAKAEVTEEAKAESEPEEREAGSDEAEEKK